MKKFSKKGMLLFAGAMAVCAFVLPAVSSAASWSPINNHTTLESSNIGFTSGTAGGMTSSCTNSQFTTRVDNAQVLTITTGSFSGCTTIAPGVGSHCLSTLTPTNFPWRATAAATNNIQMHGVDVDWRFENFATGATCPALNGAQMRLTGTLTSGVFNPVGRTITFTNAEGLVSHPGATSMTPRGSFSPTGGLTVLD